MNSEIKSLIHQYLDDEVDALELRQLNDWIKLSPDNAAEFAKAAMLHDRLFDELNASEEINASTEIADFQTSDVLPEERQATHANAMTSAPSSVLTRRLYSLAALAAAILLMASMYWVVQNSNSGSGQVFATLAFASNAQWEDEEFQIGDTFGEGEPETIVLASGIIKLAFKDGAEVTLEGPARYQLLAPNVTRLLTGILAANVPQGAEGFRVSTPDMEITDLGTAFGVHTDSTGASVVSVFEGEVEVEVHETNSKTVFKEGQQAQVLKDKSIATVQLDPAPYGKVWPVASGIESTSGAVQFLPPWPRRMRLVRSDENIFIGPERIVKRLEAPLAVNISATGKVIDESELTPAEIPVSTRVRSFVLHFHPENQKPPRRADRVVGSVTFQHPVLGIIARHDELLASGQKFSRRNAGEAHERRQLEFTGDGSGDMIELSDDRRTVHFELTSPRRTSDLIRVIVDAGNRVSFSNR